MDQPLVSIITPSFNQASFIKETINSVASQDYPNIEHIVIDGGSTDGTVEILENYRNLINNFHFISERDQGQSHAINKGLHMASGSIIGWLNSDDTYLPHAITKAVSTIINSKLDLVYGEAYITNTQNRITGRYPVRPFSKENLFNECIICQPAAFIKKDVFLAVEGVDEELQFCMDYDLWMRISNQNYNIGYIPDYLANSRLHSNCKTSCQFTTIGLPEIIKTSIKNFNKVSDHWLNVYRHYNTNQDLLNLLGQFTIPLETQPSKIIESNQYDDLWAPPNFTLCIQSNPLNPIRHIILKGIYAIPIKRINVITVVIDGKPLTTQSVPYQFTLTIPIPAHLHCTVQIFSNSHFIPAQLGMNSDTRSLCFLVEDIQLLSEA